MGGLGLCWAERRVCFSWSYLSWLHLLWYGCVHVSDLVFPPVCQPGSPSLTLFLPFPYPVGPTSSATP